MNDYFSCLRQRHSCDCPVVITRHARERMLARDISEAMLVEIIDEGKTRFRDATHLWTFKNFPERHDNLLCAVLVLEDTVVVKTVMHHFSALVEE